MKAAMRNDPKARALEVCLQNVKAGANLEQALASYPRWADELRPLVESAIAAQKHTPPQPAAENAQAHSRAGFLQVSQRMLPQHERRWMGELGRFLLGIFVVAALAGLLIGGIVWVSSSALPGDLLYPIKRYSESIQLKFISNPAQHLALELAFDGERVEEIQALTRNSRPARDISFTGYLSQPGFTEWLVGDIQVTIPANAQLVGELHIGYFVNVQGDLLADGTVHARRLQMREHWLQGTVQSVNADRIIIAGITILLTPETTLLGIPIPGSLTQVVALRFQDGSLQARNIEVIEVPAP